LKLTFVIVDAAATAPTGVTSEDIYLENAEWTSSTSGSGFNAASTNNPRTGTKCIEGTTVANGAYVQLQSAAPVSPDDFDNLVLYIRSKATWANNRILRAQFYSSGVAKGSAVTIASGYWGFDSSNTSGYQLVAIPLSQFVLPAGGTVNQLRFTDVGGSIGFYLDDIALQSGGGTIVSAPASGITQDQADARYLALTGGTLSGDLIVPDEAYGVGWNASLEVPTKNAVYDKIEALAASGISDGDKGDVTVSSSGTVWTVDNDAITYAKIQNVSATDKLLGRSTSGAGDVEEIACTAAGRALLDDADAAAQRTTLLLDKLPIGIACSDETTAITTGTAKATFRMPFAFTLTEVRASVTTAPTGSTIVIDINENGSTILSTKLSIDASEKTSTTAATPAVISDASLADDAEITIDFDQVGSTVAGAGVKVFLIGYRNA
jgi:hypothetical protein